MHWTDGVLMGETVTMNRRFEREDVLDHLTGLANHILSNDWRTRSPVMPTR